MNAFIFEYHFAFYHVTKTAVPNHMTKYDNRSLRQSSPFGGLKSKEAYECRHIYEEQMSILLAGTGTNLYHCYQLGEKYFKAANDAEERTFVHRSEWSPSILLLTWIAMALHHVAIRWQNAISAVDDLITNERDVVFLRSNNMSGLFFSQVLPIPD
jgi:hypothetical protein